MKNKQIIDAYNQIEPSRETKDRIFNQLTKKSSRPKWRRLACSLIGVVLVIGVSTLLFSHGLPFGGSSGGGGANDAVTYMSYAGPVFPLTTSDNNQKFSVNRNVNFDFSIFEDSQIVWGSEITDTYHLVNESETELSVKFYYPYANNLGASISEKPQLLIDGVAVDTELIVGRNHSLSFSSWSDYKKILQEGQYLTQSLKETPDLNQMVTIYSFDDFESPEEYDAATLAISFHVDSEKTHILSYGFNGNKIDGSFREFSFFVPKEGWPDHLVSKKLIVIGEDPVDYQVMGYKNGATDKGNELEGVSSTITKQSAQLSDVLMDCIIDLNQAREEPTIKEYNELIHESVTQFFYDQELHQPATNGNVNYIMIEDIIEHARTHQRVFYVEFDVTLSSHQEVELKLIQVKNPSHDHYTTSRRSKDIQGYDMVTQLGSQLSFESQSASLSNYENMEIVSSNMGFDLNDGITEVVLGDEEHYYLQIKPK